MDKFQAAMAYAAAQDCGPGGMERSRVAFLAGYDRTPTQPTAPGWVPIANLLAARVAWRDEKAELEGEVAVHKVTIANQESLIRTLRSTAPDFETLAEALRSRVRHIWNTGPGLAVGLFEDSGESRDVEKFIAECRGRQDMDADLKGKLDEILEIVKHHFRQWRLDHGDE